ncbi:glycosyltransferase family 2 protein [Clostridium arbusti]|uniref:glycosyltransferase family 2 protein n=1 Tax=Clostridium arbusti TaxID=1137848 RepID=UPI000287E552|nr:glycosyltransferase family 2 protein [Clostridium arbusti]
MISIIVPIYNAKAYLNECIESLLNQTNDDYELILIDDGSTDNSLSICRTFQTQNCKIRVFHKENEGVSVARQFGITKAMGEIIAFVDSDDRVNEMFCEYINLYSEDYDVLVFSNNLIKEEIIIINDSHKKADIVKGIIAHDNSENYKGINLASVWGKAYKRSFLLSNQISFDKELSSGEDMMFNIDANMRAEKILLVKKSIYFYRQNPNSATTGYKKSIVKNDYKYLKKLENILSQYFPGDKSFEYIYGCIVLNGIWICMRQYFANPENPDGLKVRISEFKLILGKWPYNKYLLSWKKYSYNMSIVRKLCIGMLNLKLYRVCFLFVSFMVKGKKIHESEFVEI